MTDNVSYERIINAARESLLGECIGVLNRVEIEGRKVRVSVVVKEEGVEYMAVDKHSQSDTIGGLRHIIVDKGMIRWGDAILGKKYSFSSGAITDEMRASLTKGDYVGAYFSVLGEVVQQIELEKRRSINDQRKLNTLTSMSFVAHRIKQDIEPSKRDRARRQGRALAVPV